VIKLGCLIGNFNIFEGWILVCCYYVVFKIIVTLQACTTINFGRLVLYRGLGLGQKYQNESQSPNSQARVRHARPAHVVASNLSRAVRVVADSYHVEFQYITYRVLRPRQHLQKETSPEA
jgi:hypothetical protein